ncbi:MAG: ABC transporter permease subunit [Gammaproteobacteria bacterium]
MTNPSTKEMASGSEMNVDRIVSLLKRTVPFEPLSERRLTEIAEIAVPEYFKKGDVIYKVDERADDVYVIASGSVEHALGPSAQATQLVKIVGEADVVGWAALLKNQNTRLAKTTCLADCEVFRINGPKLIEILATDQEAGKEVMTRFAKMLMNEFTVPAWLGQVQELPRKVKVGERGLEAASLTGMSLVMFRLAQWLRSPRPYLMLIGFAGFIGLWYLLGEGWHVWRFNRIPGPVEVWDEWTSRNPVYGISIFTPEYYTHIWYSVRRIIEAFVIATALGVPFGLFLGWSKKFREYTFPVFETLRPIPILAWVPLAILMFSGTETPVIFLTALASFYATALNTMLGVESIDESYPRAAACLGANKWQVFRHVIIPGALPHMFTGLQISVGVAWFSLVAAEMVSGQYGLGYLIMTSYTMVSYPTIIIGMVTLGIVGYVTSALVRLAGDQMMQWRVRELALGGGSQ